MQSKSGSHFRAVHPVDFADPYRGTAILVLGERILHRVERCRPVMLRPVELNPSGYPRSSQTDERRLNYPVVIDEIIVVRFVDGAIYAPANLRHNFNAHVFVFQNRHPIGNRRFIVFDFINDRMRVYSPCTALIHSFLQKHRILIRLSDPIGWNRDVLFPYPYCGAAHVPCRLLLAHLDYLLRCGYSHFTAKAGKLQLTKYGI
ncbi:hypothetical protein D3C77_315330 [compost metagenome]